MDIPKLPVPTPLTTDLALADQMFTDKQMRKYGQACAAAALATASEPTLEPDEAYMFKLPGDHDWHISFLPLPGGAFRVTRFTGERPSNPAFACASSPAACSLSSRRCPLMTSLIALPRALKSLISLPLSAKEAAKTASRCSPPVTPLSQNASKAMATNDEQL